MALFSNRERWRCLIGINAAATWFVMLCLALAIAAVVVNAAQGQPPWANSGQHRKTAGAGSWL